MGTLQGKDYVFSGNAGCRSRGWERTLGLTLTGMGRHKRAGQQSWALGRTVHFLMDQKQDRETDTRHSFGWGGRVSKRQAPFTVTKGQLEG